MNTALFIIVISFASLVGAAVVGGAIGLGAVRFGRWLRQRPATRLVPPRERESLP